MATARPLLTQLLQDNPDDWVLLQLYILCCVNPGGAACLAAADKHPLLHIDGGLACVGRLQGQAGLAAGEVVGAAGGGGAAGELDEEARGMLDALVEQVELGAKNGNTTVMRGPYLARVGGGRGPYIVGQPGVSIRTMHHWSEDFPPVLMCPLPHANVSPPPPPPY